MYQSIMQFNSEFYIIIFKVSCGSFGASQVAQLSKESTCHCRRCESRRFDPWVRKIPWRRKWQSTPVFLPGKSPWTKKPGRLQSMGLQRVGHNWVQAHTWTVGEKWYVTRKEMLPNCWDLWVLPSRTYSVSWGIQYVCLCFLPSTGCLLPGSSTCQTLPSL